MSNEVYGVHAVAANDVWAVGHTFTVTLEQTLALHWDGTQWTDVPTPHPSRYSRLRSVDASALNDVWAVGEITRDFKQRTLTQHFDGTSWVTVPSPNEGISVDYMSSVSLAAPNDVWVVGYHIAVIGVDQPYQTSSFHYDGTSWRKVDAPDENQENNYLRGVTTVPGKGAFAVGGHTVLIRLKRVLAPRQAAHPALRGCVVAAAAAVALLPLLLACPPGLG